MTNPREGVDYVVCWDDKLKAFYIPYKETFVDRILARRFYLHADNHYSKLIVDPDPTLENGGTWSMFNVHLDDEGFVTHEWEEGE